MDKNEINGLLALLRGKISKIYSKIPLQNYDMNEYFETSNVKTGQDIREKLR